MGRFGPKNYFCLRAARDLSRFGPVQVLPASAGTGAAVVFLYTAWISLKDIVSPNWEPFEWVGSYPGLRDLQSAFAPAIRCTLAFICLYFSFLWNQTTTHFFSWDSLKEEAKKNGEEKPPRWLDVKYGLAGAKFGTVRGNMCARNTMEQGLALLPLIWLHAVFVSPGGSALYGWIWLFFRVLYPFCIKFGPPTLFLSTIPGYGCLVLLGYPLLEIAATK